MKIKLSEREEKILMKNKSYALMATEHFITSLMLIDDHSSSHCKHFQEHFCSALNAALYIHIKIQSIKKHHPISNVYIF